MSTSELVTFDWNITEAFTAENIFIGTSSFTYKPPSIMRTLGIAIGFIGLMGNAFVIMVIFTHTAIRKQLTNLLIINQSLIDAWTSVILIFSVTFVDTGRPM